MQMMLCMLEMDMTMMVTDYELSSREGEVPTSEEAEEVTVELVPVAEADEAHQPDALSTEFLSQVC